MVKPKVLVAGIGNDLCQDDGFGIVTLRRLSERGAPEGVRLYESGIAGIGLVQELMDGYEALIIVDAVDRDGEPGTLYLLETEVPALDDLSAESRAEFMADMHYTVPSRALILCKALDVLPPRIYFLGCQPASYGLGMELSAPAEAAVDLAIERIIELASELVQGGVHVPGHTA